MLPLLTLLLQTALAEANVVAHEAIGAMRTVFSFAKERAEQRRYDEAIQRYFKLNVRQTVISALYFMSVSTFLINCLIQVALLWVGAKLVTEREMSAGNANAF